MFLKVFAFQFLAQKSDIFCLEDAWSEDVKIAETSMNESKPEKLGNGVSSQDLGKRPLMHYE